MMKPNEILKMKKMVITDLFNKNGYIKGFGPKLCRVMDSEHNPLYNISREIIDGLIADGKLKKDGLIFKLNLEN